MTRKVSRKALEFFVCFMDSPPWVITPRLKKWRFGYSPPNTPNKTPDHAAAQENSRLSPKFLPRQ
jgi:hypothetical protein